MKPVHVGLAIAAAAFGGALVMKYAGQPSPAPAPEPVAVTEPAPTPLPEAIMTPPEVAPEPSVELKKPAPSAPARPVRRPAAAASRSKPPEVAQITPALPAQPPAAVQIPVPVAPAPPPAAQQEPTPVPQPALAPEPPPPPPAPRQVTLTAGTLIPVRLVEALVSDRMQVGDTFTATLDAPLIVDGLVIAERGARAEGRIVHTEQAGRVKGVAALGIELTRLRTSDGQQVRIQTETFEKVGQTTVKEDAAKVGVAAGIGAAIGAIAGGGKGAGIGAAVGGAAGTGGVLATRGKPVTIPSETKISFRLLQPATLTERK